MPRLLHHISARYQLASPPAGCFYGSNADISYARNPSGQKTANMSTVTKAATFLEVYFVIITQQLYVNLIRL